MWKNIKDKNYFLIENPDSASHLKLVEQSVEGYWFVIKQSHLNTRTGSFDLYCYEEQSGNRAFKVSMKQLNTAKIIGAQKPLTNLPTKIKVLNVGQKPWEYTYEVDYSEIEEEDDIIREDEIQFKLEDSFNHKLNTFLSKSKLFESNEDHFILSSRFSWGKLTASTIVFKLKISTNIYEFIYAKKRLVHYTNHSEGADFEINEEDDEVISFLEELLKELLVRFEKK